MFRQDFSNQLARLRTAQANPFYRTAYPAMAALDPFVSFPLLGNCSNRQACAPAPWGNTILGNAAVNASVANVNLPAPAEFPTARSDLMLVDLMATLLRPTLRFLRTPLGASVSPLTVPPCCRPGSTTVRPPIGAITTPLRPHSASSPPRLQRNGAGSSRRFLRCWRAGRSAASRSGRSVRPRGSAVGRAQARVFEEGMGVGEEEVLRQMVARVTLNLFGGDAVVCGEVEL